MSGLVRQRLIIKFKITKMTNLKKLSREKLRNVNGG